MAGSYNVTDFDTRRLFMIEVYHAIWILQMIRRFNYFAIFVLSGCTNRTLRISQHDEIKFFQIEILNSMKQNCYKFLIELALPM